MLEQDIFNHYQKTIDELKPLYEKLNSTGKLDLTEDNLYVALSFVSKITGLIVLLIFQYQNIIDSQKFITDTEPYLRFLMEDDYKFLLNVKYAIGSSDMFQISLQLYQKSPYRPFFETPVFSVLQNHPDWT